MPDKDNLGAVLQPIGYRWQNDRDGLQQDDAVAAMRASTGSSGFHEMNHPVVVQPVPFRDVSPTLTSRMQGSSGWAPVNEDAHLVGQPVPFTKSKRAQSVTDDKTWVDGQVNPTLSLFDQGDTRATTVAVAHAFYSTDGTHGVNQHLEVSPAVKVGSGIDIPSPPAVAFSDTSSTLKGGSGERGYPDPSDGNGHSMVGTTMTVRRLTARECERLQAFPDDYTLIPWRKKQAEDCPDGPRYRSLGNSMAVNCMSWIGERIAAVDAERNKT
jgi:site-specific DNA-cytosine methylase